MAKLSNAEIKQRTDALYDSLPMELEARLACKDIRDEITELNYSFFGYIAKSVVIESVGYEDKLQTALLSFLQMWWKYKYAPKYRTDLSFAVFFKPRLMEEVRRNLCKVSYTTRRGLCMKAAKQLNKAWTEITYDDLSNIQIGKDFTASDMVSLKSVLGADYPVDLSDIEMLIEAPGGHKSIAYYQTDKYDDLEEMLIQEMIEQERALTDKDLKNLAEMLTLDYYQLKQLLPKAMDTLYKRLKANQ